MTYPLRLLVEAFGVEPGHDGSLPTAFRLCAPPLPPLSRLFTRLLVFDHPQAPAKEWAASYPQRGESETARELLRASGNNLGRPLFPALGGGGSSPGVFAVADGMDASGMGVFPGEADAVIADTSALAADPNHSIPAPRRTRYEVGTAPGFRIRTIRSMPPTV